MRHVIVIAAAAALTAGAAYAQQADQAQPGQAQPEQAQAGQEAQAQEVARLQVQQQEPIGEYVTDFQGRTLYMFTADQKGAEQSACQDACAEAWPPLTTQGEPQLGEQLQQDLVGTIQRQDGSTQVTYNGWPLYYFVQDQGPGQLTGQDKQGFGGEWYVVSPSGEPIEQAAQAQQPTAGEGAAQPAD